MAPVLMWSINLIVIYSTIWQGSLVQEADGQQCPEYWFGENCSYICYCGSASDCDYNGTCKTSRCRRSRFGPGCQYVDLLYLYGAQWNPSYLTDANDSTCSEDDSANFASVSLSRPVTFLWFRITVKDPQHLRNFTVTLNILASCTNEKRFILSETEIDVSCDTTLLLRQLELRGAVAYSICSIRISGGRNVALQQETWQSSTQSRHPELSGSHLAVDGNADQEWSHGSCTQTTPETEGPSWKLTFKQPHILIRAVIFNRLRENDRNFIGNTLETFDHFNNLTSYTKVTVAEITGIYEIMILTRTLTTTVKINRPPNIAIYDRVLNLCEVFLYGERMCPEGMFGLYCDRKCKCEFEEICNVVTGVCAPGCPTGKYGFNCSFSCSETCDHGLCHSRFGGCQKCIPGYTGDFCNVECPPGMYGLNCKQSCSEQCQAVCDFHTGVCSCVGNFSEPLCDDCLAGYFGENCTEECPDLCYQRVCERLTGTCSRCQGLRVGPFCEDCPTNYYGSLCYTKCSSYCENGTCNKEDGQCSGCTEGYRGRGCTLAPSLAVPWKYVVPLPLVAMLICFGTLLILRRRQRIPTICESAESLWAEERV